MHQCFHHSQPLLCAQWEGQRGVDAPNESCEKEGHVSRTDRGGVHEAKLNADDRWSVPDIEHNCFHGGYSTQPASHRFALTNKLISKKKVAFPVRSDLQDYLDQHGRAMTIPVTYEDLLRFEGSMAILDKDDRDTLWVDCLYAQGERDELVTNLKRLYSILHADGSDTILPFLTVDSIAYCTFGNTKPFRIKVRNIINDNYLFLYVKRCDASRIYGLELEQLLSPNRINFLVHGNTLIEEHIVGIPGDVFIEERLPALTLQDQRALAKEFVKFNERCFLRLLGDMRSYNYVVVITQDFDRIQYRIRAIDFDQQSYEGNARVYQPEHLPENAQFAEMTSVVLPKASIEQYVKEERALLARRAASEHLRLKQLLMCMRKDELSASDKVDELKGALLALTGDVNFKRAGNMGGILEAALDFIQRNFKTDSPFAS